MPLKKEYPADFERLYEIWPKWPKGRTKKYEAYKAFLAVKKEFRFDEFDINKLEACIKRMHRDRQSWVKGHVHGPKGLQHWFTGRVFLNDIDGNYPKKKDPGAGMKVQVVEETHEEAMRKIEADRRRRRNEN